jgi:hypothetical protein
MTASRAVLSLLLLGLPAANVGCGHARPPAEAQASALALSAGEGCPADLETRAREAFANLAEQAVTAGMQRVGVASMMREDAAGTLQLDWADGCRVRLLHLAAAALSERGLLPSAETPRPRKLRDLSQAVIASGTDEVLIANAFRHDALYDVTRITEILKLAAPPEGLDGILLGRFEASGEMLLFALLVDAKGEFVAPAESRTVVTTPEDVMALVLIVDSSGSMKDNDPHAFRTDGARMIARTVALAREPTVLLGFVGFDSRLRWTVAPARVWQRGVGEGEADAPAGARDSARKIIEAIDQIDNGAQTNMQAPLEWALTELAGLTEVDGRPVTRKDLFLLTDGVHNEPDDTWKPSMIAAALAAAGIRVWAVGLGPGAQKDELAKLARQTHGRFFDVNNEKAMADFLATYLATYQPMWRLATEEGAQAH